MYPLHCFRQCPVSSHRRQRHLGLELRGMVPSLSLHLLLLLSREFTAEDFTYETLPPVQSMGSTSEFEDETHKLERSFM